MAHAEVEVDPPDNPDEDEATDSASSAGGSLHFTDEHNSLSNSIDQLALRRWHNLVKSALVQDDLEQLRALHQDKWNAAANAKYMPMELRCVSPLVEAVLLGEKAARCVNSSVPVHGPHTRT